MKPTGLNGEGRGSAHRYYDIKKNILSYELLCEECHIGLDTHTQFRFSNAVYGRYILKNSLAITA